MQINHNKNKKLTLGPIARRDLNPLVVTVSGNNIERVITFKLFGVHIDSDLRYTIALPLQKVNSRLYTLKQLNRSGLYLSKTCCSRFGARTFFRNSRFHLKCTHYLKSLLNSVNRTSCTKYCIDWVCLMSTPYSTTRALNSIQHKINLI
jgi:hypothetical protein